MTAMSELLQMSVSELSELVHRRDISPVEVADAMLDHIDRENPRLNAIVSLAIDVREQAQRAADEIARGIDRGPLHGIPLTIKDTIETAGLRTTSGSKRRAEHVPVKDAPVVARLRAAGAIILGKTNTSELAMGLDCENPLFGPTNNPLEVTKSPGGSSGGEAAAIAGFLSPGGLGSDLLGSVRIPAHFCGIVSLKPTSGSVPLDGQFPEAVGPYALGATIGPMARSVSDLELLFDVMSGGPSPHSPFAPRARRVSEGELRDVRVAVYADDECASATPETVAAVQNAAAALRDAGLEIAEELPPGISRGPELWNALFGRGSVATLRSLYTGHEDDAGPIVRAILKKADADTQTLDDYLDAWTERDHLRAELLEYMEDAPLLLCPVGSVPAFEHGTRKVEIAGRSLSIFDAFSYCRTFNLYGLPVACVPAGRSPEGLPIGVQIVGRPFAEAMVLAAAKVIERINHE
jgi:amidase